MSRKRKRLKKLLMALRIPRDDTDFYIDMGLIMDLSYAEQMMEVKDLIRKRQ